MDGILHRTVRPGTFQHTITNLKPDHMYKVHVRAKNPKQMVEHDGDPDIEVDLLTAEAEFRTEPGGTFTVAYSKLTLQTALKERALLLGHSFFTLMFFLPSQSPRPHLRPWSMSINFSFNFRQKKLYYDFNRLYFKLIFPFVQVTL